MNRLKKRGPVIKKELLQCPSAYMNVKRWGKEKVKLSLS